MPTRSPHRTRNLLIFLVVLIALNWALVLRLAPAGQRPVRIPFTPNFITQVKAGNVSSIASRGDTIEGMFKTAQRDSVNGVSSAPTTLFTTEVPAFWNNDQLAALLQAKGVQINAQLTTQSASVLVQLLFGFGPTLLIVGLIVFFMRRAARSSSAGGTLGAVDAFGRSKARRADREQIQVTFADVAGIDEAKAELTEIVDFLRRPERYARLGGRMPHGVLLSGSPGTGKTLLARAVAGEAHASFFSISASEFVEVLVGVGASRVRDLFEKAREAQPSIVFIDELDAVGRARGGHSSLVTSDEREQTLNQILTEMDGFEGPEAVVVLAATNRPEILDAALLRPGRFDRRVAVHAPDRDGRRQILAVHTRSMPLADSVDLDTLAASMPGMVGAELANLANEAALLATRRDHNKVWMADFTDALEKIMLGARRGIVLLPADRERTAYHEAGHALVGMLTPGADPLRKISIIPRGMSLGVTIATPDTDRVSLSRGELDAQIRVALGGRVAEEVVYAQISTGAESDIQQLTEIARQMVGRWGMSTAIGPMAVIPRDGFGPMLPGVSETSAATQQLVDEEVRRIIETAHEDVTVLLSEHRQQLDSLAHALLDAETLDALDAYTAAGLPRRKATRPDGRELVTAWHREQAGHHRVTRPDHGAPANE